MALTAADLVDHVIPHVPVRQCVLTVNVGRTVVDAGGRFAGVLTAALDPEYFQVLLASVLYAAYMRAALLHGDGTLFLHVPAAEQGVGVDRSTRNSFFTRHRDSGKEDSALVGQSLSSGAKRLIAMRTLRNDSLPLDQPLMVGVSRDLAAIDLPWRREAAVCSALLLVFVTAAGFVLAWQQRRRAERHDRAERLELALAGADLGLWDWHLPSGQVVFNPRWFTMLGHDAGAFEANIASWRLLLHSDAAPRAQAAIDEHLAVRAPFYELEHRLRNRAGDWQWAQARGRVVQHSADGKPLRLIGTHMDIAARKAVEAALNDSHILTQQLIDNLPHGFAVRDAQLRYMRWNPMMEKLTGVPAERAIVRTTEQVFPEMDAPLRDALQDALDRALQGELVVTPDRLIDRPDKRYRTTAIHGPLRDAQGRVVGAISSVQEITDRKRSEEQPLKSRQHLAVTLQSIGDAVISTDAAGRINLMSGCAECLTG